MPIQTCQVHQLRENVIYCEGECLRRFCPQCFMQHNLEHNTGVFLNQTSKNSLIQWNQYLLGKFEEIRNNIKPKGINCIFQMKLNPSYPKGLLGQLSNSQIADVGIKIINEYLQTLDTNIRFISARQDINQLDIPELLKDIFIFFVYESGKGLSFLNQKMQNQLKLSFPAKKMYEYVDFAFVPKQLRQIQNKRKAIIKNVESETLKHRKKDSKMSSPIINRNIDKQRVTSPRIIRSGVVSPRKALLLSNSGVRNVSNRSNLTQDTVKQPQNQSIASPQKQQAIVSPNRIEPSLRSPTRPVEKIQEEQKVIVKFEKEPQFQTINKKQVQTKETKIEQNIRSQQQKLTAQNQLVRNTAEQLKSSASLATTQVPHQPTVVQQNQVRNQPNLVQNAEQIVQYSSNPICTEEIVQYNSNPINNEEIVQYNSNPIQIQPQVQKQSEAQTKLIQQLNILKQKLNQKQRTIRSLNNLINNQQQQIHYRENQVQILTQQIKKLIVYKQKYEKAQEELNRTKLQLKFKDKSINTLNNLIGNEELQLLTRQNEVETLTIQIKKLVEWKNRCQQIGEKLNQKQKQLNERERGIKQLNNVISNEEEQLAFRQSQVQTLTAELKKAEQAKNQYQLRVNQLAQEKQKLVIENQQLHIALKNIQKQKSQAKMNQKVEQNFDQELMEQVIHLESQVVARNQDIRKLATVVNGLKKHIPKEQYGQILNQLKSLRTIKLAE